MTRTHFTISQDGQHVGSTPIIEQAVNAAKTRAKETGKPVSVVCHYKDADDREVIFNPDGSSEKIWKISGGELFTPKVGETYINNGGGTYLCRWAVGNNAGFVNTKSGWAFRAVNCRQYVDGTIDWDRSTDGYFMEG